MNTQSDLSGSQPAPYILDWSDLPEDAQGARTALLQCVAKVYTWSHSDPSHASPDGWAQAFEHLPLLGPAGLQSSTYGGADPSLTWQTFVDAVVNAAGAGSPAEGEVAAVIGPIPRPGTTHVIQIVSASKGECSISQLVATASDQQGSTQPGLQLQLTVTSRRFSFDWPTLSGDAAVRHQWDQLMNGVSTSTVTNLPTYHRLRLAA